ncbi:MULTISPECIES: alpha-glucan family phosphorylase [unclassified Desulfovibrio]|uniref:alpha-glucan family phosphorylase n=1 Tax=unclassified Desulfovibrio TaxID=2593640 RepID=UPI000F5D7465|nr:MULTISPECIES: alpha-glucan family phosphorylase [unclassified Desulfovibrio]RRD71060.1 alpha-glucan family phosphorylase [Desulfovibrio sp. OH1209_COT-279]RRD87402.1 alpha-glucan family phosphorylase [Desulfovibrio sp. OH1186_COT-070]
MEFSKSPVTLFEVSWEVCNKVGGIYSVVSSKALQAVEHFGEDYFLLGPLLQESQDFEETDEHLWDSLRLALAARDLKCRLGRWNIPGRPKAILVDFAKRYAGNQLLYDMWKNYGVDSLSGGWDYLEPVMFSSACGEVIAAIHETRVEAIKGRSVALFHEWMCGAGLLMLKKIAPAVGTVFTTHATMLGRALAGNGRDIYSNLRNFNPASEAVGLNVTAKWSLESASAREADIFTTVSPITGEESTVFLGRTPDVITTNGLDMRVIPDYSADRSVPESHRAKVMEAAKRFLRCDLPKNTRIFVISGRYEMHNKGVDVFLEALARTEQSLTGTDARILVLCLVMGGHTGPNPAAISGAHDASDSGRPFICTHYAWNAPQDPIINSCRRLGLDNSPDRRVKIIFVPAMLDGNDGFFNMPYEEVLTACDYGFFPSWYEPWGYTPQESAAWSVPTLTTDLSGFGMWAREQLQDMPPSLSGVLVLPRRGKNMEQSATALHSAILSIVGSHEQEHAERRKQARRLADRSSWGHFFANYLEAFHLALKKADTRVEQTPGHSALTRVLTASCSATPFLRPIMAVAEVPAPLARLRDLAQNVVWSWLDGARNLFMAFNPALWESCRNPLKMLERATPERFRELLRNEEYMALYHRVMENFDTYMAEPLRSLSADITPQRPIAYFSTEYGLNESIPIYSGGLGILSGDHLKSASDMAVPLVGVGLLYKNGYFKQEIDENGRQIAQYPINDFAHLPVKMMYDEEKQPVFIQLELPGRLLFARVWKLQVGRVCLYLMDTDTRRNTDEDRKITNRLYEANREIRLLQEMVLGMGGMRLLRTLKITPSVFHMNEGHSAFMVLERLQECLGMGMNLPESIVRVRSNTLFTTHTPVPAGNETFSLDLMERYFSGIASNLGLSWQQFLQMGQIEGGDDNSFQMTVLALRYSCWANGVSRLHGVVSRHMWNKLWKGLPHAETPIGHITNGIHTPSYVGNWINELLTHHLGSGWLQAPPGSGIWDKVDGIPDDAFWGARMHQKEALLEELRGQIPLLTQKLNLDTEQRHKMNRLLKPETLVIGFARRFAPYKRATLLFADPERLERILTNPQRPVVLVFSGKAHPADEAGINLIQEVVRMSRDTRFLGHIFFLENYSMGVSRLMSQGCDVWLNTPRRPHEASGTSGMKLPVNGGLNLSISDGWWCEGYNRQNGWTIGPVISTELPTKDQNDYLDAESLYTLLEETVSPLYYDRDSFGLPHQWIAMAKRSLKSLTSMYSSNRMLTDYIQQYYLRGAARRNMLHANDWALCRELATWEQDLPARFGTIRIEELAIGGVEENTMTCGEPVSIRLHMHLGEMKPEEVLVQLVIGQAFRSGNFRDKPEVLRLDPRQADHGDNGMDYAATYIPSSSGNYRYGVRVMPMHPALASPLDTGLILWA